MKSKNGISLVELVIVMIIMILLVSFTVFKGIDSINKSEATELYEEMTALKTAVSGIMTQKFVGEYDDEWLKSYYNEDIGNGWYEIKSTKEAGASGDLAAKYEVDTIRRNYLINFETGEITLSKPIELMGTSVRTYDSVRALVESNRI